MGELVNFTFTNHKDLLCEGLWKCLQSNFDTNFVLSGNSEGCNTGITKIHTLVFAIFCPMRYLKVKLNSKNTFNLSSYGVDLDDEDVKTLVEFIYRGNVGIKEEKLSVVKSGAEVLGLNDLVNQIESYQKTREQLPETSSCGNNQHDDDFATKTNDVLIAEKTALGEETRDETIKDQDSNGRGKKSKSTRSSLKRQDANLIVEEKRVVKKCNPRSRRIIILSSSNKNNNSGNKITSNSGIQQRDPAFTPKTNSNSTPVLILKRVTLDTVEKAQDETKKDHDSNDSEKKSTKSIRRSSKSEDNNLIVEEKRAVKKCNPKSKRIITLSPFNKSNNSDNKITSSSGIQQRDTALTTKTNENSTPVLINLLEKVALGTVENAQDEISKDQDSNDREKESESTRSSSKSEDAHLIVEEKQAVKICNPKSKRIIILGPFNKSNNLNNKITSNCGIQQNYTDLTPKTSNNFFPVFVLKKTALDEVEKSGDDTSKDHDSNEPEKECKSSRRSSKSKDDNLIVGKKRAFKKWNPRSRRIITLSSKTNNSDKEEKPKLTIKWVSKVEKLKSAEGRAADYYDPISKTHLCKHCGKAMKDARLFLMHLRCHEDPSLKHKCQLCDYETSCKNKLKPHMAVKHHLDSQGNKLEKNIKCPDCAFTCVVAFQLNNHRLTTHAKRHKCDVCGYLSASPAALKRHVAVHQKERNFLCDNCGFKAKTLQVLKKHVKIHEGKKMVCSYCGQSLTVSSFDKHLQLHTSDLKPHACHLCKFATRKKYALKVHLKNVHKLEQEPMETNWLEAQASALDEIMF